VEADDGQIGQVIQNMVLNAGQAMPEGGTVEITCRNVLVNNTEPANGPRQARYVQITITDDGTGILKDDLDRIFDPYFTTKEKGSGLGLATSYSIIKNHHGWIDVRSRPGKGTTFVIHLPAVAASVQGALLEPEAPAPAPAGRVLVMDDEPHILDVAGELLRALGHDVVLAADGSEALEKYTAARESGAPFTAVILDLTIRGGMGGEETIHRIRQLDPDVRAVVSSGYSDNAVISNYAEHGFCAFLRKPYHLDELRDILARVMTA
jgi:CheY-like chemotaxis protein